MTEVTRHISYFRMLFSLSIYYEKPYNETGLQPKKGKVIHYKELQKII